ncbi:MAG: CPBP family intramembrane glutamic endopeptidase [Saprospiraceae bacterium]
MKTAINRITIFTALALMVSFVWFGFKSELHFIFDRLSPIIVYCFALIPMLGLVIGSYKMRQKIETTTTFQGNDLGHSLVMILTPIALLTYLGVSNSVGVPPQVFGFFIGCLVMLYAFLEEYGWRGYLQEELHNMGMDENLAYVFIGFIWFVWHWYFLRLSGSANMVLLPIFILASAGIGKIIKQTNSITIAAAFHGIVNILFTFSVVSNGISMKEKLIIGIVFLMVWATVEKKIKINNVKYRNAQSDVITI